MGTALVTGANRGIGLELCRQLSARGEAVVAVCRTTSAELDSIEDVRVISGVDLLSADAEQVLIDGLDGKPIDLAILNAGILRNETLERLDVESIRAQFEVNALGPLRLASALAPAHLKTGAKLMIVTSRMGSIEDNTSGGRYGYRMSKAAVNMATRSLAHDLGPRGVAAAVVHPGFVRTEMTGGHGFIDPSEAASGIISRCDELHIGNSGSFWHQNGEALPW